MLKLDLPALDPKTVEPRIGITRYPEKYQGPVTGRERRALGDACGLKTFGVNLTTIPPGGWSAQRHWHSREDEFVFVVEGELVLVTNGGEQTLGPGMCAGFPAGKADGHHLVNRSGNPASYLEMGGRDPQDAVDYPDIDMKVMSTPDGRRFTDKKGEPY
jgi:uncharacterized cupin superfamily protein